MPSPRTTRFASPSRRAGTAPSTRQPIQGADNWSITHIHDVLASSPKGRFAERLEEFEPRLARSWTVSPDARTWTFQIRQGVQFHKGFGECTAEDVVFSLDRARDPRQGGANRALFENIADVRAEGRHAVVVSLRQPDPLFLGGTIQDYSCVILSKRATE